MIEKIKAAYLAMQNTLSDGLAALDAEQAFVEDVWQRPQGGGGITRVLEKGAVFAKGGVNFSHVSGAHMPPTATALRPELSGAPFEALGISVVMHPKNPYAPISHFNIRYFQAQPKDQACVGWFGGGFDLTPIYGFEEDCVLWHQMAKSVCDASAVGDYARFKKWCDDYFYIKHRGEARGIGGIFFDDITVTTPQETEVALAFTLSVAEGYLEAYSRIIQKRAKQPFTSRETEFQHLRRGRYVEFNLVYDRGTLFGLQSGGRTESILMSLPPDVSWSYAHQPEPGSAEARLYQDFLPVRDWV